MNQAKTDCILSVVSPQARLTESQLQIAKALKAMLEQDCPKPAFRAAKRNAPGVRTFYVASESKPGTEYVIQFIRRSRQRRWFCDCADFKFRKLARKRHCKHLRQLATLAREAHGVSRLVLPANITGVAHAAD